MKNLILVLTPILKGSLSADPLSADSLAGDVNDITFNCIYNLQSLPTSSVGVFYSICENLLIYLFVF